jgi:hypothetical protein
MLKLPKHTDRHCKLTVILLQRQIAALDHLAVSIRLRTGVVLSRAGIIEAFVAAFARLPNADIEKLLQKEVGGCNA